MPPLPLLPVVHARRSTAVGYIEKVIPRCGRFVNGRYVDVRKQTPTVDEPWDPGPSGDSRAAAQMCRPDGATIGRAIVCGAELDCNPLRERIGGRQMRIHLGAGRRPVICTGVRPRSEPLPPLPAFRPPPAASCPPGPDAAPLVRVPGFRAGIRGVAPASLVRAPGRAPGPGLTVHPGRARMPARHGQRDTASGLNGHAAALLGHLAGSTRPGRPRSGSTQSGSTQLVPTRLARGGAGTVQSAQGSGRITRSRWRMPARLDTRALPAVSGCRVPAKPVAHGRPAADGGKFLLADRQNSRRRPGATDPKVSASLAGRFRRHRSDIIVDRRTRFFGGPSDRSMKADIPAV